MSQEFPEKVVVQPDELFAGCSSATELATRLENQSEYLWEMIDRGYGLALADEEAGRWVFMQFPEGHPRRED
jgi:hypothetical protein